MMVLSQLHRNISRPARKEYPDDIELAKDVRIVHRKGKLAPNREVWRERKLVGKGATRWVCRCGDSGWVIEGICRWKRSNTASIGTRGRST